MKSFLPDLKIFFILIFFSLLLVLSDSLGFLKFPKSFLQSFTVPIQYGFYKSGKTIVSKFDFIFLSRHAVLENKALKKQLGELLSENANLQVKLNENEAMVDTYNKLNPKTYDLLPARIIGGSRLLVIDKGSNDGVSVGLVALFKDSYIGQVKQVLPKSSEIILSQDPDSKVAVFSQGAGGRAKGVLYGRFGSELLMDKILHQESIEVGDLVYSEGMEEKIPKGLIMGKVTQVFIRENEVFKQAKVEPIFNIIDLDMVFVMRGS